MKHTLLTLVASLAAASAFAQGTINFQTLVPPGVNALVTYSGANAGSSLWGQLLVNGNAVGSPVAFRDNAGAGTGYIVGGGTVTVDGVAGGAAATVNLVAWHSSVGSTWAQAQAAGLGGTGMSADLSLTLGNAPGVPVNTPPANLTGLQGFAVAPVVPEPTIAALGLLGAGLLVIRRKK